MLFYNLLKMYLLELFQKRWLFVINILFLIVGVSIHLIRSFYFLSNDSLFSFLSTSRDMKIVLFSYLPLLLLFSIHLIIRIRMFICILDIKLVNHIVFI